MSLRWQTLYTLYTLHPLSSHTTSTTDTHPVLRAQTQLCRSHYHSNSTSSSSSCSVDRGPLVCQATSCLRLCHFQSREQQSLSCLGVCHTDERPLHVRRRHIAREHIDEIEHLAKILVESRETARWWGSTVGGDRGQPERFRHVGEV